MDGWYPEAKKLPITTSEYWPSRAVPLVGIVDHITDGIDSRNYLQNANNGSSVHFLIREENGKGVVYQFMPIQWAAWGNGRYSNNNPNMPAWVKSLIARNININHATVSIEHERDWPFTTEMGGPMLEASIALHKWLKQVVPTITASRDYVIGHYQIDHIDRANCPGGAGGKLFPFARIVGAMQGSNDQHTFPETGYTVKGLFWAKWQQGGLERNGYPLSEQYQDGDTMRQWFENARMRLGPDGAVRYDAIGRELLES